MALEKSLRIVKRLPRNRFITIMAVPLANLLVLEFLAKKTVILTWKARWRKRFLEECFFSWSLCARQILPLDISCCFERVRRKGCAVTRAPASHQYGLGSNPAGNAIYGVSLLLVLALATRGFSLGISVFSSPQEPIVSKSNSIRNDRRRTANLDVVYSFFIHLPILPFFRPPIPPFSPVKLKNVNFLCRVKQLMRFVWNKMNLPSGLCRLHTVLLCRQVCVVFALYYLLTDECSTSRYRCSTFSSRCI